MFNLIHKEYNDKYSISILAKNNLDTKSIVRKFLIKKYDLNKKIICIQQRDENFIKELIQEVQTLII